FRWIHSTSKQRPTDFGPFFLKAPLRAGYQEESYMLTLSGAKTCRLGRSISRRELFRAGAMGIAGLTLPDLLAAEARNSAGKSKPKSCIFLFLDGGASQIDTLDMKPDAPAEFRGEFRPIPTTVPGTFVCEHLPRLAQLSRHFT